MERLPVTALLMIVAAHGSAMDPQPTFKTLSEAVAFISGCLDANDSKRLGLAATHKVSAFEALQQAHRRMPLTKRYAGRSFPSDADHFKLGGHDSELGHVHIDFTRQKGAWCLDSIWLCR